MPILDCLRLKEDFPGLTNRHCEILEQIIVHQNYRDDQIAEKLLLSTQTVRNHKSAIYQIILPEDDVCNKLSALLLYLLHHQYITLKGTAKCTFCQQIL